MREHKTLESKLHTWSAQFFIKNAIFDDFENFGFLSKIWFWGILGGHWRLGDSGNINLFWFLGDLGFFDFWVFLGGRQILAGGYGAVLVGVSMM